MTKFQMFYIFNYIKEKRNYSTTETPWYYEPIEYINNKPYSKGFATKKECAIDAHLQEAEMLIQNKQAQLKTINGFLNHVEYLEKNKCLALNSQEAKDRLSLTYGVSYNIIRELETTVSELVAWYNEIIDMEN